MNRLLRSAPRARPFDRTLRDDVLTGLQSQPKTLPAKLFYDEQGARLFEQICELDEYYLTRAELEILRAHAGDIARLAGAGCAVVEYGSGAATKTRLILDALEAPAAYVPIDVSREQLERVAADFASRYERLSVMPLCADYTQPVDLSRLPNCCRRIAFFPGSTVGNFHPAEASAFLHRVRRAIGPDGALILGVDRRKDTRVLHAAYNDAAGITAKFNLNMLARLNRELGADFDLSRFRHRAWFNDSASRVEMHLESLNAQTVTVADVPISFGAGETIWTESSYKYDASRLESVASAAGFAIRRTWSDSADRFWVAYLDAATR